MSMLPASSPGSKVRLSVQISWMRAASGVPR
jgi:hypothetical protein